MSKPLYLNHSQVTIENPFGDAELIIKNATKDTVGFLYNLGDGVTEFRAIPDMTALDPDLIDIAALTPADGDIIQRVAGHWTNRTVAQYKADLALTKADVGLSLADNTSDLDKPISTLTQAALNLRAPKDSPAFTGIPTAPTAAPGTNTTQLATTEFVTAAVSASTTGVASFKGRTGTVVPASNDYTFAQIDKTTSSLADLTTRSAGDLSSGTLNDARLSANVVILTSTQTLTNKTMSGANNTFTNISLGSLAQGGATTGQVIKWNGSAWAAAADAIGGGITDGDYGDIVVSSTGTLISIKDSAVVTAKLAALSVTDAKINDLAWTKITGKPTTIAGYGITDGVTLTGSQTLTNKTLVLPVIANGSDATGDTYYRNASGIFTRLAVGSDGQVLKVVAGIPAWAADLTGGSGGSLADGDYGDITVSASGASIVVDAGAISNSKLASVPTNTFKGRITALAGAPEDLTVTQATSMLNVFSSSLKGLAPASGGGTTTFLRADGTWSAPVGTSYSFGGGLTETGGAASIATDGVTTIKIADSNVTNAKILTVAWSKVTSTPTTVAGYGITDAVTLTGTQTLTNKTLTSPKINLGSDATGDTYYRDGSGNLVRLGIGSNGQVLKIASGLPTWAADATGGGGVSDGTYADIIISSSGAVYTIAANAVTTGKILDANVTDAKIASVAWSKITGTPTTVSGYGITDAVTLTGTQTLTNKTLTSPKINLGSDATGDTYYRDASGNLVRIPIGANGTVLKVTSGLPAWGTDSTGGGGDTYTGTTNRITVTGTQIDISSSYVGQSSITTLGTIGTGTWQGTPIATTYGGVPAGGSVGQILAKINSTNYNTQWIPAPTLDLIPGNGILIDGENNITVDDDYIISLVGSGVTDGDKTDIVVSGSGTIYTIDANAITTAKILDGNVTNAKLASGLDAAKFGDGSVSNTEFQYLANVTGDVQRQINGKGFGVWKRRGVVLNATESHEDGNTFEPTVIREGNPQILTLYGTVFKMWYSSGWVNADINYAESVDGINWTKYSGNPVVSGHNRGWVVKNAGTYNMFCVTAGASQGNQVDRYTSTDGVNYSLANAAVIVKNTATWNTMGVYNSSVIIDGSTWYMLLDGYSTTYGYAQGLYTSSNGSTWTEYGGNPVLNGNGQGAPFVKKVGSTYWAWVLGNGSTSNFPLPSDLYRYRSTDMMTWVQDPVGITFGRRMADEGAQNPLGQIADPFYLEVDNSVYLFYAASPDGDDIDAHQQIKLAVANMPFSTLVTTDEGDGGDVNMMSLGSVGGGSSQWSDVTGGINYGGGKVGIGEATPDYTLHITDSTPIAAIQTNNAANYADLRVYNEAGTGALYFRQYGTTATGTVLGTSVANAGYMFTSGSSAFGIGTLSTQNLFIGTNNTSRISIGGSTGTITFNSAYTFPTAAPSTNGHVMSFNADGTFAAWISASGGGGSSQWSDVSTGIQYANNANSAKSAMVSNNSSGGSASAGITASNGTTSAGFYIAGTGYTPYGALQANRAYFYSGTPVVLMGDDSAAPIIFAGGGNAETSRFITSSGIQYLNFGGGSGSGDHGIRNNSGTMEWKNSGGSWAAFGSGGGGSSQWSDVTGGINYSGGKVGIGESTPDYTLHITDASPILGVQTSNSGNFADIRAYNEGASGAVYFRQYGTTATGTVLGASVANAGFMFTSGSSALGIGTLSSQNVFIGTNNTSRISIGGSTGTITFNSAYTFPTSAPSTNGHVMSFNTDGSFAAWVAASGGGGSGQWSDISTGIDYTNNANGSRMAQVTNTSIGGSALAGHSATNGTNAVSFLMSGTNYSPYGALGAATAAMYTGQNIAIISDGGYVSIATASAVERLRISSTEITAASLAGSGTRMVVADASGVLSTQAIPSGGGFTDPLTTNGDIIARISGATTRLAAGTSGYVLTSNGASNNISWQPIPGSGQDASYTVLTAVTTNTTETAMTGSMPISNGEAGTLEITVYAVNSTNTGSWTRKLIVPYRGTSSTTCVFETHTDLNPPHAEGSGMADNDISYTYNGSGDFIMSAFGTGSTSIQWRAEIKKYSVFWSS